MGITVVCSVTGKCMWFISHMQLATSTHILYDVSDVCMRKDMTYYCNTKCMGVGVRGVYR